MTDVSVIITLKDASDLERVKHACETHGLTKISTLPGLGILKGSIDPLTIPAIGKIGGVLAVEKEREIKLPPLKSPNR